MDLTVHGGPDAGVKRWRETTDRQTQHVSIITLAEIQKGIDLPDQSKRRAQLEQWPKQDLETWFSGLPCHARLATKMMKRGLCI